MKSKQCIKQFLITLLLGIFFIQPNMSQAIPLIPIETDETGLDCISQVVFHSLTASPSTVNAFESSNLSWSVTMPTTANCTGLVLSLNTIPISANGSMTVSPGQTTNYLLRIRNGVVIRNLGTVTVNVNANNCRSAAIHESLLLPTIQNTVDTFDKAIAEVYKRGETSIDINSTGIKLGIFFKISVNNFVDPELTIRPIFGATAQNGVVSLGYKAFDVKVNWPWYVDVLSLGIINFVEWVVESKIKTKLKAALLAEANNGLGALLALFPNEKILAVNAVQDNVNLTICK